MLACGHQPSYGLVPYRDCIVKYDTEIAHFGGELVTGRTLLHYTIVEKQGEGGMGVPFPVKQKNNRTVLLQVRNIGETGGLKTVWLIARL
jgi:hypothetical protein